jgi:hypothetical protein
MYKGILLLVGKLCMIKENSYKERRRLALGVKFNREYQEIIDDMIPAIASIPDCHSFFDMTLEEWTDMEAQDKGECLRTLADDLFYGLGVEHQIDVGAGTLEYDADKHLIKVKPDAAVVHVINLI